MKNVKEKPGEFQITEKLRIWITQSVTEKQEPNGVTLKSNLSGLSLAS
jgi:hypothetical protein